jgi:nucleoredoxin
MTLTRPLTGETVSPFEFHDKTLGLYFSASWCKPCTQFSRDLANFYVKRKAEDMDDLEIVLISLDKDPEAAAGYAASMPWLALELGMVQHFLQTRVKAPQTIPSLVFIHPREARVQLQGTRLVEAALLDDACSMPLWHARA